MCKSISGGVRWRCRASTENGVGLRYLRTVGSSTCTVKAETHSRESWSLRLRQTDRSYTSPGHRRHGCGGLALTPGNLTAFESSRIRSTYVESTMFPWPSSQRNRQRTTTWADACREYSGLGQRLIPEFVSSSSIWSPSLHAWLHTLPIDPLATIMRFRAHRPCSHYYHPTPSQFYTTICLLSRQRYPRQSRNIVIARTTRETVRGHRSVRSRNLGPLRP